MNRDTNPDLPVNEDALGNEYQNMTESEFEHFLAIAVEGYADAMGAPVGHIRTFDEDGVLTATKGLVVHIGDAEFQVTIVRSRCSRSGGGVAMQAVTVVDERLGGLLCSYRRTAKSSPNWLSRLSG